MDQASRLEAHALIDQLVQDGDTFSRETAARLIALVPVQSKKALPISIGVSGTTVGPETKGHAAGVGDVSLKGDEKTFSAETSGDVPWRLGGYKVVHRPGKLTIERMMSVVPGQPGRTCEVLYDASGPTRMDLSKAREVGFWRLRAIVETMGPWKRPTLP